MIGGFPPPQGSKEERKLIGLFKSLQANDQQTLLKFAEFLSSQSLASTDGDTNSTINKSTADLPAPQVIERPAQESVIKAIKRLNKTYPMHDKGSLLDKTSSLMTDHIIKGREASSVIDELEVLFKERYEEEQS
ncbi:MAG TPA: hypothetical protein ENI84_02230 [Thiothrix sp.]|nr:hypothetical protein [Thiothrix sp.]